MEDAWDESHAAILIEACGTQIRAEETMATEAAIDDDDDDSGCVAFSILVALRPHSIS